MVGGGLWVVEEGFAKTKPGRRDRTGRQAFGLRITGKSSDCATEEMEVVEREGKRLGEAKSPVGR